MVGALPVDAPGITYIYGRQSCDTRAMDGDIDAGNRQVLRPGGDDRLRRRLHPLGARVHGRRARVRRAAGRALHLLSPPQLRLQDRCRRRADRRRGDDRRLQRRGEGLAHPRQAGGDDAPERDHLRHRRRLELPGRGDAVGRLSERRHAVERLQAPRDEAALRDRPPRAGPRRRPDGDDALGGGAEQPGGRRADPQVPEGQGGDLRPRTACACCGSSRT